LKLAIESNDENQYLKNSLEAIERSIDQQRPEGVTASLKRLLESGQEYCDTMLEEYGVVSDIMFYYIYNFNLYFLSN